MSYNWPAVPTEFLPLTPPLPHLGWLLEVLADHNQVHQSFWVVAVLQREHDERVGYGESNGGCGKEADIGRGGE